MASSTVNNKKIQLWLDYSLRQHPSLGIDAHSDTTITQLRELFAKKLLTRMAEIQTIDPTIFTFHFGDLNMTHPKKVGLDLQTLGFRGAETIEVSVRRATITFRHKKEAVQWNWNPVTSVDGVTFDSM